MKKHTWNKGYWFKEDGIMMREDLCKNCSCSRTVYLKENELNPPFYFEWVGGYITDKVPTILRPDCN